MIKKTAFTVMVVTALGAATSVSAAVMSYESGMSIYIIGQSTHQNAVLSFKGDSSTGDTYDWRIDSDELGHFQQKDVNSTFNLHPSSTPDIDPPAWMATGEILMDKGLFWLHNFQIEAFDFDNYLESLNFSKFASFNGSLAVGPDSYYFRDRGNWKITYHEVPAPAPLGLMALGLAGLALKRRIKRST